MSEQSWKVAPNGNAAHRKHCNPIGIPTIVMHQMQPMASHKSPIKIPPNNNHKIFPNNLILSLLLQFFTPFYFVFSGIHSYLNTSDSFTMHVPFFVVLIFYYFL